MVELKDIKSTKVDYRGNDTPISELPKGMYSIQLKRGHPSYPYLRGDGKDVAERIFNSPLNRGGRLRCQELEIDEVEYPDMFRFGGEVY